MSATKPLLTADVARQLGVAPSRVRHWVAEGKVPRRKIGRDLVFTPADVRTLRRRPGRGRPKKTLEKQNRT